MRSSSFLQKAQGCSKTLQCAEKLLINPSRRNEVLFKSVQVINFSQRSQPSQQSPVMAQHKNTWKDYASCVKTLPSVLKYSIRNDTMLKTQFHSQIRRLQFLFYLPVFHPWNSVMVLLSMVIKMCLYEKGLFRYIWLSSYSELC